jgi:hypothetical protein
MTTKQIPRAQQGRDTRSGAIVDALVRQGLVGAERQGEAVTVVDRVLGTQEAGAAPLRRRFAELAGYVGGVFVVSAAAIFFATRWGDLSEGQQVALLAGVAALLAVAGLAISGFGAGFAALRRGAEPALRRLVGVLLLGAAGSAAAAVGMQADYSIDDYTSMTPAVLGFGTFTVLALGGYLLAPTVVGQVAIAGGLFALVPTTLQYLDIFEPVLFGLLILAVGVAWLLLAERGTWREVASARVVGCVLIVAGAQIPAFDYDSRWVGYVALFVVAVAAFGAYVARRAWPYLAAGVVALTLAVPEALTDWTDNTLGPAGILLVAGLTLLGASLVGLRLRKEVVEAEEHEH